MPTESDMLTCTLRTSRGIPDRTCVLNGRAVPGGLCTAAAAHRAVAGSVGAVTDPRGYIFVRGSRAPADRQIAAASYKVTER